MIYHETLWAITANNTRVLMTAHQMEHVTTKQDSAHVRITILETTAQSETFHFLTN